MENKTNKPNSIPNTEILETLKEPSGPPKTFSNDLVTKDNDKNKAPDIGDQNVSKRLTKERGASTSKVIKQEAEEKMSTVEESRTLKHPDVLLKKK